MSVPVEESYRFCERVARAQARNFYLTFLLLSPSQRRAMCAIYAFMRYCDDLSDAEGIADRAGAIERWRQDLHRALSGDLPGHPVWPAFADAVARYRIPHEYFEEMIAGVRSDLEPRHIESFDELYRYCYQVASVVGLTIIHVFGFESPEALRLAEKCGVAFQITNILRDVKEDAENGRVYLPAEDLRRFGVALEDLRAGAPSPALRELLEFEARRARAYYAESAPLTGMVHRGSRASLRALIGIYSRLLDNIAGSGYDVLARRIGVPTWQKLWILARSLAT
jgi:phytoene synthase